MKALILAAGFGTRLYPLTENISKPLLKLGKKHLIDYILESLKKIRDCEEILIITNQRFYKDFLDWAKVAKNKRLRILNNEVSDFKERLGAIGDMQFAIDKAKINEDLLVIGGDTFLQADLNNFIRFSQSKSSPISVGLYYLNRDNPKRYAVVKINGDSRVIYYKEKPKRAISKLVGICLYYFPKERLGMIKEYLNLKKKTDAPGNLISWLYKRTPIYGFKFRGLWFDIGHPDTYRRAKEVLENE